MQVRVAFSFLHLCSVDLIFLFYKMRMEWTLQTWQVDVSQFHDLISFLSPSGPPFLDPYFPAIPDTVGQEMSLEMFPPSGMSFPTRLWCIFPVWGQTFPHLGDGFSRILWCKVAPPFYVLLSHLCIMPHFSSQLEEAVSSPAEPRHQGQTLGLIQLP